ncbi:MAG: 23S rRNA (guanosine(2251)-2'-O)-methyltransferase RlmB [Limnochordia bacterium]|jgi:23S rRNA (guanosine2251-2'-O)-methyltransferase|nr:23S rRNA (guanosine(2251)-2'-O)-methyltransferase RlmB [Limnochordia bacterium]
MPIDSGGRKGVSNPVERLIFGRNPVLEAIGAGRVIHKIVLPRQAQNRTKSTDVLHTIKQRALQAGIPVEYVNTGELDELTQGQNHQGVVALVEPFSYTEFDLLMESLGKSKVPLVILLDHWQDPQNLGSLLRSAEAAGVDGIILPKRRSVGVNATVAKVAAGALEYVKIVQVTNLVRTIEALKERGLWIAGASANASQVYFQADFTMPLGLVIGSEGTGLSRLVEEHCDFLTRIPMKGQISSLNAAVSAALLIFEVIRQRQFG